MPSNGHTSVLLVTSPGCDLAAHLVNAGRPVIERWLQIGPPSSPEKCSPVEALYRALDRGLFGSASGLVPQLMPQALPEPATLVVEPDAVLVWLMPPAEVRVSQPCRQLVLMSAGRPFAGLVPEVRAVFGQPGGVLPLQWCLRGEDGGLKQVFEAFCALDHRSFQRSLELAGRKVAMTLQAALARLNLTDPTNLALPSVGPTAARPRTPIALIGQLMRNSVAHLLLQPQWQVMLCTPGTHPHDGVLARWRAGPVLHPPADHFWADPFMVSDGQGGHYCFVEELPARTQRGRIAVVHVDRLGNAQAARTILEEPWHLSYPFVFEHSGQWYMVPESSANRSVDLYRCDEWPWRWRRVATLLQGVRLADATLHHDGERWWMFGTHGQVGASMYDELNLYHAPDLFGPWQAHRLNPVKVDARSARPAGALFKAGGQWARPTQDCSAVYGGAVVINRLMRLDESGFEEVSVAKLSVESLPAGLPVHTLNTSGATACIDLLRQRWRWAQRLLAKVQVNT